MKTDGNDLTFPIVATRQGEQGEILTQEFYSGLTKREYFAALAMQGLCVQAIPGSHNTLKHMMSELPQKAVTMADALIAELNKEQK